MHATARSTSSKKTRFALCLGAGFPLLTLVLGLQFFWVPAGSSIRPMGWPVLLLSLSLSGFTFVSFCAGYAYHLERRLIPALLAVVLSITPLPLGVWLLRFASQVVGFTLAP